MKDILILITAILLLTGCYNKEENSNEVKYNETIKTILERRSVRTFTSERISLDTLELIVKAGMAAPTGLDKRPWEFIIIDNKEDVYKFYQATGNDRFKTAPSAIIVCGNTDISDLWYIDCSCAAENILLAVQSMGLGAVFTAGFPIKERVDAIRKFFNLPENIIPLCSIPIGHQDLDTHPKDKYNKNKIHINVWQTKK